MLLSTETRDEIAENIQNGSNSILQRRDLSRSTRTSLAVRLRWRDSPMVRSTSLLPRSCLRKSSAQSTEIKLVPTVSLTVIVACRDRVVRLPLLAFAKHANPQVFRTLTVCREKIHLSIEREIQHRHSSPLVRLPRTLCRGHSDLRRCEQWSGTVQQHWELNGKTIRLIVEVQGRLSTVGDHLLTDSDSFVVVTVHVGHVRFAHQRLILLVESAFDRFT